MHYLLRLWQIRKKIDTLEKTEVNVTDSFKHALVDNRNPYWLWGPLAFSIFYFLPLIFNLEYFIGIRILGVAVIYLTFLMLYKKAIYARGEEALVPVLSLIILCIAGTYVTPGTQALFGYAAYFCGFNFRFTKAIQGLIGILLAIVLSANLFSYMDAFFLAPALIVSIGMFFFGQAERKDRIHQAKEVVSQQKVEQYAAVAERERIARDLHDLVGHSLSSIALKANLAEKLIDKAQYDKASNEIHEVAELSRDILSQVREAVSGLKKYNLSEQLNKLIDELKNQGFDVTTSIELPNMAPQVESSLQLICTELVTNIMRHSDGDAVNISISSETKDSEKLIVSISDNGKEKNFEWGNGLSGIKERCQEINAQFTTTYQNGFNAEIAVGS